MGLLLLICLITVGIALIMVNVSNSSVEKNVEYIQQNTASGISTIADELLKLNFTTTRKIAVNYLG